MKLIKRKLRKGFTLVELVVTIAIIAILSAASVATYFGVTENARKSTAKSNADEIARLIQLGATTGETFVLESTGIRILTLDEVTYERDTDPIIDYIGEQNLTVTPDDLYEPLGSNTTNNAISTLIYKSGSYSYSINCQTFVVAETSQDSLIGPGIPISGMIEHPSLHTLTAR